MSGVAGRSGGHNRLSVEQHVFRGTFVPSRHGRRPEPTTGPVSAADRRRTLKGLSPAARRLAAALLETFEGWDVAALQTLRSYALSCDRLAALEAAGASSALYREVRANLALLAALHLEPPGRKERSC